MFNDIFISAAVRCVSFHAATKLVDITPVNTPHQCVGTVRDRHESAKASSKGGDPVLVIRD
jgi:hypothetical protein